MFFPLHVVRYPWKLQLNLVIFAGFCQKCQGMSKVLQNSKALGRAELFVYLLRAVTTPWKLQCYNVVLVGYGPASPKFFEATNTNIFGKGCVILLIFSNQLFASCQISIEATKICHFGLTLSGIASQLIRLLQVKNSKTI